MTVIFMDYPQNLSDHILDKSDPIAHNGMQNVLVYHIWQNLTKFLQGEEHTTVLERGLLKSSDVPHKIKMHWIGFFIILVVFPGYTFVRQLFLPLLVDYSQLANVSTSTTQTWLMMKMFGIFRLNFLWLRNTTITFKFATIPMEAVAVWIIRTLILMESLDAEVTAGNVEFSINSPELVTDSIVKWG